MNITYKKKNKYRGTKQLRTYLSTQLARGKLRL